jgi:hypothetical protein
MTCSIPTSGINVTTTDQSPNSSSNKMYRGVRKRKWGKWVSEIRLPNSRERIWLGSYDTQEKAARAFDAALYCLRGPHASFNFPNTPLTINVAVNHGVGHQSLTPEEIQEVAAKYANESPTIELTQEEDQQVSSESQNDANSNIHSYSCQLNDNEGMVQVDYGDLRRMDWRFEDMFDDLNGVANCSNFYGLQNMQYSTQVFEEDNVDQIECEDTFSDHSTLWNWNF